MNAGASPIVCDVLVIGAGPAGLAAGAALRRAGLEPTLVERGEAVGWSWRGHYDRLRLHTVKEHSALPFLPFADGVPRYPSRLEVIAYLEAYARRFDLEPRFGEEVRRVYRVETGWCCETDPGSLRAPDVVIATGYNRAPVMPVLARPGAISGHDSPQRGISLRRAVSRRAGCWSWESAIPAPRSRWTSPSTGRSPRFRCEARSW